MSRRSGDSSSGNRTQQYGENMYTNSKASYLNQTQGHVRHMTAHHTQMTAVKPTGQPPGYTMPGYSQQNAHVGSDLNYSQNQKSGQTQSHGTLQHAAGKPATNSGQFGVGTSLKFFPPHNIAVSQGFNITHHQATATVVQNSNHTIPTIKSQTRLNTPQPIGNMLPYSSQNNQLVFKHQNPTHSGNMMLPQPTNQTDFPPIAQNTPHGPAYSPYYGHHPVFPPRTSKLPFMPINYPPPFLPPAPVTCQKVLDKKWLDEWLKQREIKQSVIEPQNIAIKIGEAQKLVEKCSELNEKLRKGRDELIQNIEMPENEWKDCFGKINAIKEELLSVQKILKDPAVVEHLQKKIIKRRKKRTWFKNRMKRRHLEKMEDAKRRERLHQEIDKWQKEKVEKDVADRKEATLKREAGGVLGEVRRKQTDGRKLLELLESIKKLREIRKSEGEKKGVYPKTSSDIDRKFTEKSEMVENFITKRIKSYEDEEKTLRVMLVEEEEEREKKNEQERMEQKALLNLTKDIEADPLADFQRYYNQVEHGIEFLVQIRRDWDAYIAPAHVFGASRIPDGDVVASPPSSDVWLSVVKQDGDDEKL